MTEYECDKGHRWFSESETRCPQCFPPVVPVNDGGPAFPNITPDMNVDGGPGMSLRDWFAGQALAGFTAFAGAADPLETLADLAYRAADAMLAAREGKAGG